MKQPKPISTTKTAPSDQISASPNATLDWIADRTMAGKKSESAKNKVRRTQKLMRAFIDSEPGHAHDPPPLQKVLTKDFLVRFYQHLLDSRLSLNEIQYVVSGCRDILRQANKKSLTAYPKGENFIDVSVPKSAHINPGYGGVYSETEMKAIAEAVAPYWSAALAVRLHDDGLVTGPNMLAVRNLPCTWAVYFRKGVGKDPTADGNAYNKGSRTSPWKVWDNVVWYFENRMDCKPLGNDDIDAAGHACFRRACSSYWGGLTKAYERLHQDARHNGAEARIIQVGTNVLVPLLVRLLAFSALNPNSALTLKIGCVRQDPISGHLYLTYFKKRSGGEKKLYLSFLADLAQEAEKNGNELGFIQLTESRGAKILKVIRHIEQITQLNRERAASEVKDFLFLAEMIGGSIVPLTVVHSNDWLDYNVGSLGITRQAQSASAQNDSDERPLDRAVRLMGGRKSFAQQCDVGYHTVGKWLKSGALPDKDHHTTRQDYAAIIEQATKGEVTAESLRGAKLSEKITMARFRPTVLTELVEEGKSVLQVQMVAGHAGAGQTVEYFDLHDIKPHIHKRAVEIASKIHKRSAKAEEEQPAYGNPKVIPLHVEGTIYPGLYSDCSNVFDPHPDYRKLATFGEGMPCGYWNGCLLCAHVLITRKHLPLIASLELQFKHALARKIGEDHPQRDMYELKLAVIDSYFNRMAVADPKAVEEARANARFDDVYFDPLVSVRGA